MILPNHQKLSVYKSQKLPESHDHRDHALYIPAMKPRYAGWANSTIYAGPAPEAMAAPKPRTNLPPMNCPSVFADP